MNDDLTPEELERFGALLRSKQWRLRNLYLILDEDGKTIPLVLRPEQEQFLGERHSQNFVPKARKLGMSTVIVIDYLDECVFNPNRSCGHIDLKDTDAHDKLQIARFAWKNGPLHPDENIAALWRIIQEENPMTGDSAGALEWLNGSRQTAGVSYTGKTPQRLHVSEYGPIAAQFPKKAQEIKRGSMNAVPITGIKDVETTMEGGRFGECYHIFKLGLKVAGHALTPLDWKIHFFPWQNHPSYRLPGHAPNEAETIKYFAEIKAKHGIDIPLDRQAWYEIKRREQGEDMFQQFPTVVEECDMAVVAGQILTVMTSLRAKGRIREFEPEPNLPKFTFWDLGASDNSAGWLIQPCGKDDNWLDWCAGEGMGAKGVADVIHAWETKHGPIAHHYVPHDAKITDKGSGKTYLAQLVEAGVPLHRITVVNRTPDVWVGINDLRALLARAYFHSRTDVEIKTETGASVPSGVGRLEGYRRTPQTAAGAIRVMPFPDICSHTADAARTFAEARSAGLIHGIEAKRVKQKGAIMGFAHVEREPDDFSFLDE